MRDSFSTAVKEEITKNEFSLENKKSLLAGITRHNAAVVFKNGKKSLAYKSEISSVSKFIYGLLKDVYGIEPKFSFSRQMHFDKSTLYHVIVNDNIDEILLDLEVLDSEFTHLLPKTVIKGNLFQAFMTGVFLVSGMVTDPTSPDYYLEYSFDDEAETKLYLARFAKFAKDRAFDFKISSRRDKTLMYLKKSDQISLYLAYVNAPMSMLDYENKRVMRDYLNSENRLQICTNANYGRISRTGTRQICDILLIYKFIGNKILSNKLRELCEIRLSNQDISLLEISSKMQEVGYTISKSGVNHLFVKISKMAEEIRGKEYGKGN